MQKIVTGTNPTAFEREVNQLLEQGWKVVPGSMTNSVSSHYDKSWNRNDVNYLCSVVLELLFIAILSMGGGLLSGYFIGLSKGMRTPKTPHSKDYSNIIEVGDTIGFKYATHYHEGIVQVILNKIGNDSLDIDDVEDDGRQEEVYKTSGKCSHLDG